MARKKQRQKLRRTQRVKPLSFTRRSRLRSRFYIDEPVNDLRRFTPYAAPITLSGRIAKTRLDDSPKVQKQQTKVPIKFANPIRVTICLRRKVRRSVLFSRKKVGKGKSVKSFRRLNEFSKIKC